MVGEEVVVVRFSGTGADPFNSGVLERSEMSVCDVLVCPASPEDEIGGNRPDGISSGLTLHFPKGYEGSLRGCKVVVRGVEYDVVGDPLPFTGKNTPTRWNRPVKAVRVDG